MPFRRTRIAYLNQHVDADLRKKSHCANWPTFLRVFCLSSTIKKGSSSEHLQTAEREKISHYYGQFGEAKFLFGGAPLPLVAALPTSPRKWLVLGRGQHYFFDLQKWALRSWLMFFFTWNFADNLRGFCAKTFFFLENTCTLCPWPWAFLSLATRVCPRKVGPWPWIFFCALGLVSWTPPLLISIKQLIKIL